VNSAGAGRLVDDAFALCRAAKRGLILNDVQRWLLDIYLVGFEDAEADEVVRPPQPKVQRSMRALVPLRPIGGNLYIIAGVARTILRQIFAILRKIGVL